MAIKMTVHENRHTPAEDWHNCGKYNQPVNDSIKDNTGAQTKRILSAIPSPFARMHLFETAFEIINTNRNHLGNSVYHKMISDCFDVLEILFNWNQLIQAGNNLEIRVLAKVNALNSLIRSNNQGHKNLGQVLNLFFSQDAQTARFNYTPNFYLLICDSQVFAGSSPMTLFFTRPDLENFRISKNATEKYFEKTTPFHLRSDDFQKYIHLLFHGGNNLRANADKVFTYILDSIKFIPNQNQSLRNSINQIYANPFNQTEFNQKYQVIMDCNNNPLQIYNVSICHKIVANIPQATLMINPTKPLPSELKGRYPIVPKKYHDSNNHLNTNINWPDKDISPLMQRVLPDYGLRYPYLAPDDFLEDTLIQVDYPINRDFFVTGKYEGFNGRDTNGFLLPLKNLYFEFFDLKETDKYLTFKRINQGVKVELEIPVQGNEYVKFEKSYYPTTSRESEGKLVKAKFNFAIFPFYKTNVPAYNNFYKIMVVNSETDPTTINREYSFDFFNDMRIISSDNQEPFYVAKTLRVARQGIESSSTYYEIKKTTFDLIRISCSQLSSRALIIPKLREVHIGEKTFTVAVDFGTTNTFVALTDDQNYQSLPKALSISENDIQVVAFNMPKEDDVQQNIINRYEKISAEVNPLVIRQTHEFIPSIIGVDTENVVPKYAFPLRSVISEKKGLNLSVGSNADFLGNMNISFIYEKEAVRQEEEQITSDLKWTTKNNIANEKRIECFIFELLLLIKNKIILNGGNPANTRLIWFRPLSMGLYSRNLLEEIWKGTFQKIFNGNNQPECITESQAPYYYILRDGRAFASKPILCIDIGGGSTDIVFFDNRVPKFGTSFNFAGSALWGSGLGHIAHNYNGIISRYSQKIDNKLLNSNLSKEERERLNTILRVYNQSQNTRSEDLMNLYFAHDSYFDVVGEMRRDPVVKFLILLHFSAIVYHSLQIIRYSGMDAPRFISLTGRGSRYIHIIEPNFSENGVTSKLVNQIVFELYGIESAVNIITHTGFEKEATCYGGIYYKATNDAEPESKVYLGEYPFVQFNDSLKKKYSDIDSDIKKSVVDNINNFYEIFFRLNAKLPFKDNYGIDLNLDEIKTSLTSKTSDYLELGIEHRLWISNENDEIGETLFFYPIIKALFELSKDLYDQH